MHRRRQANTCLYTKAQTEQDVETPLDEHPQPEVWAHCSAKFPVCDKHVRDGEGFPIVGEIWLQWGWGCLLGVSSGGPKFLCPNPQVRELNPVHLKNPLT